MRDWGKRWKSERRRHCRERKRIVKKNARIRMMRDDGWWF